MTKRELADIAAAKISGMSKADAAKSVDLLFEAIVEALRKGEDVRVSGFGTFSVTNRAARTGRNPSTGDAIEISAAVRPRFKPGAGLVRMLGGPHGDGTSDRG
jgi:DNA-binding protein HU-beta